MLHWWCNGIWESTKEVKSHKSLEFIRSSIVLQQSFPLDPRATWHHFQIHPRNYIMMSMKQRFLPYFSFICLPSSRGWALWWETWQLYGKPNIYDDHRGNSISKIQNTLCIIASTYLVQNSCKYAIATMLFNFKEFLTVCNSHSAVWL